MRSIIDTNLFIYASYTSFPQYSAARSFLKQCLEGSDGWCLSWGIIYEYLRVVTHAQLFPQQRLSLEEALQNVSGFITADNVEVISETAEHYEALKSLAQQGKELRGNILHDAHTVVLMKEHDIRRIYTADTDFYRFKDLVVINPLPKKF